jgi:UPF0042 nucleotide-binding protein
MKMTAESASAARSISRRTLIVTGLSGAGKSQALKVLEDIGFFCVDNLPLPLLENFLEFCGTSGEELSSIAVGMDVRGRGDPSGYPGAFSMLRSHGHPIEVLFLEAEDRTLYTRYRETRRPHPLEPGGSVLDVIRREREALAPLRGAANWVIDTSSLSIHELRRQLIRQFQPAAEGAMAVTLMSFGFRYGVPFDVDLVFDVRFLPNPHFVSGLRELDGRNVQVSDYIFAHEVSREFLARTVAFLEFLLPQYQREGKTYLTIGIGCTGGQHRSVALVEALRASLERHGVRLEVRHRDLPEGP